MSDQQVNQQRHPATWDFRVRVEHGTDGWTVEVHDKDGYRATVSGSHDVDTALKMAVPYIATCCEQDPFEGMIASLDRAMGGGQG